MTPTIHHGDCLDVLREMPDNSVHAVITDPPYGLSNTTPDQVADTIVRWVNGERDYLPTGKGFMGKEWDGFVPPVAVWDECMRVLKPGGHVLAFAGTRTVDLMTLGLRLAGFDIRESILWVFGSGFPKSHNVSKALDKMAGAEREVIGKSNRCTGPSQGEGFNGTGTFRETNWQTSNLITAPATDAAKQWEGWGSALKPATEPIVMARKPFKGTLANNVLEHGTGAINVDACRIGANGEKLGRPIQQGGSVLLHGFSTLEDLRQAAERGDKCPDGRDARATLARALRYNAENAGRTAPEPSGRWPANVILDEHCAGLLDEQSGNLPTQKTRNSSGTGNAPGTLGFQSGRPHNPSYAGEQGGASRFFYVAKAPKRERPVVDGVSHPTTKPLTLMRYLVRMVTPPGGTILEPFAGSGTTIEAAMLEGFHVIGIEREAEYLPLIHERIRRATEQLATEDPEQGSFSFEETA